MVKLFSIVILHKSPNQKAKALKSAYDVQSFSYFQRGTVKEFMGVITNVVVERTQIASRQSINEGEYMCHVYVRGDGLAGVVISDHEYPSRVAHTLISKVLDEFLTKYPPEQWEQWTETDNVFPQLSSYLAKYQNPRDADPMTRMQDDLDETKEILHKTLEAVLERGEKLDDLVAKSEGLSTQSKMFYKTAKKTNSCCNIG